MDIQNNKQKFQFESRLPSGDMAYIEYRWKKAAMVIMHTWVPASGRGQGIGEQLIRFVLDYARVHGIKIIPYCPFTANYIKSHPEFEDLLAPHGH